MSFTNVKRTFKGERCDSRSETHVYYAKSSSIADTCNEARSASDGVTSVPDYGDSLGDGSGWVVTDKQVRRLQEDKSPLFFEITVIYSSPEFATIPPPDESTKVNISVAISGVEYEQPVYWDNDDNPIENVCHETYDPPLQVTNYDEQIVVRYTAISIDSEDLAALRGKVSSDSITMTVNGVSRIFAAGTLKMGNAQSEITLATDGEAYWTVMIPLMYREDGWIRSLPNMGYIFFNDDSGNFERIKDEYGDPVSVPSYLDAAGEVLAPGDPVVKNDFDVEDTAAFSTFLSGI